MKSETAAMLLENSFNLDDLDGFELACRAKPWASRRDQAMPLISERLAKDKKSRDIKIADTRAKINPFLTLLAQHGHDAHSAALADLGRADRPSLVFYATEALRFQEHSTNQSLLHRLVERKNIALRTVQEVVDAGFDVNGQDGRGNTPLHAIMHVLQKATNFDKHKPQLVVMRFFQERGVDFFLANKAGITPADLASALLPKVSNYPEFGDLLSSLQAQVISKNTVAVGQEAAPSRALRL